MNPPAALDLSFAALRAAYRERRFTPRELLRALHARALAANVESHLYISLLDPGQLEPYLAALDAHTPDSLPLYGLPFAIKDNIDLAGVPTTAACPAYAYQPQRSASVVERLVALGAIPTGKTNLDQFATGLNGSRSPYGACPNAWVAEYPSGGSSAGSALAVALGLASFALGTDTAGSGRVPAALNHLVGCKPTRGLLSTHGVVPACRTLDCVSLFTQHARESSELLGHLAVFDADDAYSRRNPMWNAAGAFGRPRAFRFGLPRAQDLAWLGCSEGAAQFERARAALENLGGVAVEIDLAPFLETARLLYEGPWVAERYLVAEALLQRDPEAVLPVIRGIVGAGARPSAAEQFRAQYRLQALKQRCDAQMAELDCLLTPTIARAPTSAELQAEPVLRNSELGTYTNFVNLLDYAAVAVPTGFLASGLPWGVSLVGRAFTDQWLLGLSQCLQDLLALPGLAGARQPAAALAATAQNDRARVVVCGAHLQGLPLNHQLTARGARLLERTVSAPQYRLYALAGGPPQRPGMVRDRSGASIEVEVWELPSAELGSFLAGIPAPLGLGKVQLADGRWETGFICEPCGLEGAVDITACGGWRAYCSRS